MKGIITIATKHALYGRYAYNLAVSVRANAPEVPISIIADPIGISHLNETQLSIFDRIITPDQSDYYHNGKCTPLTLKYHLPKYTPYDHSIFMDADTILTPTGSVSHVFSNLEPHEFTIANRGEQKPEKGVSQWIDTDTLKVPYWYDLSSEFIYWKQGKVAKEVFKSALKHYKKNAIPMKAFAGDKPDEPFLMMGMIEQGVKPHKSPYKPSYWYAAEKFANAMQVKAGYLMFSLGGKIIPPQQKKIYDELCKNATYKCGLNTFSVSHKMSHLTERKVI